MSEETEHSRKEYACECGRKVTLINSNSYVDNLRERIKVLEAVRDAAECTQEGNLYSSDLYKALKESEVINE